MEKKELFTALVRLLDSPDLNLEELDFATLEAIDNARLVLGYDPIDRSHDREYQAYLNGKKVS